MNSIYGASGDIDGDVDDATDGDVDDATDAVFRRWLLL